MTLFLYTFLIVALAALKVLTDRRAARLERKFARVAGEAELLARSTLPRGGNIGWPDPAAAAKRQLQLALLAHRRDRLEVKQAFWQTAGERLGRLANGLRGWKGRKLPYTLGVLDVGCVFYLIDTFGPGHAVSVRALVEQVAGLLGR